MFDVCVILMILNWRCENSFKWLAGRTDYFNCYWMQFNSLKHSFVNNGMGNNG